MIRLSNGHAFEYMVASGALAFDGRGWWWEKPLVFLGIIKPELFTIVTKTLTREPRKGNLQWYKPWKSVKLLKNNGVINKVDLTNPGIEWWCKKVAPKIDFNNFHIIVSIYGSRNELVDMTHMLNHLPIVGVEINVSCPNTGTQEETQEIISSLAEIKKISRHPLIIKVSYEQNYKRIASEAVGLVEAVSINTVRWKTVFGESRSPLHGKDGDGGISGKPAQKFNWYMVKSLSTNNSLQVIAPSVMEFTDLDKVRKLGAKAISFGAIHIRAPWKPTTIVKKDKAN